METPANFESSGCALSSGEIFAERYKILSELGHGGICDVYLAHEVLLDRDVAIKVLRAALSKDQIHNLRFQNEARAASKLQHPNVVSILSFGSAPGDVPYIAMEYVEGVTLEQYLKEHGKISLELFGRIFLPVLNALVYAHGNCIIHRDIKPANIMFSIDPAEHQYQVKLLDFGLAKIMDPHGPEGARATIALSGTPFYMSPEQCSNDLIDGRADIYSLACVMYESLFGKPPFVGDHAMATMYGHLNEKVSGLEGSGRLPELPLALAQVLSRALAKKPAERQNDMAQFESEIASALNISARKSAAPLRNPKALAAIATGLIALAALFLLPNWRSAPAKTATSAPAMAPRPIPRLKKAGVSESNLVNDARDLLAKKQYAEAEKKFDEAVNQAWNCRDSHPEWLCEAHIAYGRSFEIQQKYAQAEKQFKLAIDVFKKPDAALRLNAVAGLCHAMALSGRQTLAFDTYKNYLNQAAKAEGNNPHQHLAHAYSIFGGLLVEFGNPQEGLASVKKGLDILWSRADHHDEDNLTNATWTYYDICCVLKKNAEGLAMVHKTMNFLKDEREERDFCHVAVDFGFLAMKHQLWAEARDMFEFAVSEKATAEGPESLAACTHAAEFLQIIKREHPQK